MTLREELESAIEDAIKNIHDASTWTDSSVMDNLLDALMAIIEKYNKN